MTEWKEESLPIYVFLNFFTKMLTGGEENLNRLKKGHRAVLVAGFAQWDF